MNSHEQNCQEAFEKYQDSGWKSFKQNIENDLNLSLDQNLKEIEELVHTYFVVRKRNQKAGKIDRQEMEDLWDTVDKKYSKYFLEIDLITSYIFEKIPVDPVKTNIGKRR